MPYLKINHDVAKVIYEEIELPPDSFLKACYEAIGCRYIEVAPTVLRGLVLIIDEEAKLSDDWHTRVNQTATQLYGSSWDCIVGDVILARAQGEHLVPLTAQDVQRVTELL